MGTRVPGYKHEKLIKGDKVLVQNRDSKKWEGPFIAIDHRGSMVDVEMEGAVREVNRMRVAKFYEWGSKEDKKDEVKVIDLASDLDTKLNVEKQGIMKSKTVEGEVEPNNVASRTRSAAKVKISEIFTGRLKRMIIS